MEYWVSLVDGSSQKIGLIAQTPTNRWAFQIFESLDVLSIWQNETLIGRQLVNLRPVQRQILQLVGKVAQNCYFLDP